MPVLKDALKRANYFITKYEEYVDKIHFNLRYPSDYNDSFLNVPEIQNLQKNSKPVLQKSHAENFPKNDDKIEPRGVRNESVVKRGLGLSLKFFWKMILSNENTGGMVLT